MNSNEIRKTFLNFFKKNNHEIIHSSPLVPQNDPTLMFANSGMVQFKNIFTGKETRKYNRATTAQKCVRAGGKHNDLENVGYTTRHHTFFEMLGNFSFGDYFKDIAIEFAWNLITKEYGIDKNRLLVTIYSDDEQALKYWKKISGFSENKIIKINTNDNFWSMGETGPCGPCSEIFFDHGDKYDGGPPGSVNEDGDRFIEIWNLVFMQFEQINKRERINLPKPSIDTGMGLERMTALLNGSNDNYSTDLFLPLINKSIELSDSNFNKTNPSHRVIADHLRSAAFIIADGVMPSNEGRGYVLRRIMRRGMRHAHTLGNKEPIFHKLFPTFLNGIKSSYPELERASELIVSTLLNEETKFKETVENGIKILDEATSNNINTLDGEIAFKLYDTYGFPLDLTQDYLKDKKIKVDVVKFKEKMEEQKTKARKSWKGTGDIEDNQIWFSVVDKIDTTDFIGYKQNESESVIVSLISNNKSVKKIKKNQEGIIILNQTPFYGESGGQVGDKGIIKNSNFEFKVNNTSKVFGNYYLHWGEVIQGECNINDIVFASIDKLRRDLIKSNHSSTHLLHAALRKILGKHVTQKGSLVNNEKLRFDFNHNEQISDENIIKINNLVNQQISNNTNVDIKIIDQKKAIEEGAMALFGEKYSDDVRVVSMGFQENNIFSKELCGGTHVNNTGEILKFKIINHSSVASGIRRIDAISNITVDEFNKNQKQINIQNEKYNLDQIKKVIKSINKLDPNFQFKINNNQNTKSQLIEIKKIYEKINQKINLSNNLDKIITETINEINFTYLIAENFPMNSLKKFIDDQKNKFKKKCISLIISNNQNKLSIVLGVTNDMIDRFDSSLEINEISKTLGGKGGGGRKDLAQAGGQDSTKINQVVSYLREKINNLS